VGARSPHDPVELVPGLAVPRAPVHVSLEAEDDVVQEEERLAFRRLAGRLDRGALQLLPKESGLSEERFRALAPSGVSGSKRASASSTERVNGSISSRQADRWSSARRRMASSHILRRNALPGAITRQ
jgi:hypothetical protein